MQESLIRSDKQVFFNQIRGSIDEINEGSDFCDITIKVGHENKRLVNFTMKRPQFEEIAKNHSIGEKVTIRFYISSRKKHGRWYTTASVLDISNENIY
jgi:hypothetical protein